MGSASSSPKPQGTLSLGVEQSGYTQPSGQSIGSRSIQGGGDAIPSWRDTRDPARITGQCGGFCGLPTCLIVPDNNTCCNDACLVVEADRRVDLSTQNAAHSSGAHRPLQLSNQRRAPYENQGHYNTAM